MLASGWLNGAHWRTGIIQLLKQKRMFPCTVHRCGVYSMYSGSQKLRDDFNMAGVGYFTGNFLDIFGKFELSESE